MNCCIRCKHFKDSRHSRVYITPICSALGDEDARIVRQYVCGIIDARLYEPNPVHQQPNATQSSRVGAYP